MKRKEGAETIFFASDKEPVFRNRPPADKCGCGRKVFLLLPFLCPPFPPSFKLEASLLKTRSDGSGKKRERRRREEEEERQVLELRLIRDLWERKKRRRRGRETLSCF